MKKITALVLVIICVFSLAACTGRSTIVSIRYDKDNLEMQMLERFYYDEENIYYFPTMRSMYIIVTYLNGDSEDIVTALKAGRATIADLDRFGIEYKTKPKEK